MIVISETIQNIVKKRCKKSVYLINNGVPIPEITSSTDYLDKLGIDKGKYLLAVARLVPEKGLHNLIEAFEEMDTGCKLVIAGAADHDDAYSRELKKRANANDNILMPGYVVGENLAQLFSHARLFVLPSYHEGLSISLLEALSYGLPAVASNIPANSEVGLEPDCYYLVRDLHDLRNTLKKALSKDPSGIAREETRQWVRHKYNWPDIADQTLEVYQKSLS